MDNGHRGHHDSHENSSHRIKAATPWLAMVFCHTTVIPYYHGSHLPKSVKKNHMKGSDPAVLV